MDAETRELWEKIKTARVHLRRVQNWRAFVADALADTPGLSSVEVEFPTPDTAEVYQCMFGRRVGDGPMCVYRLSFGSKSGKMTWVGVKHAWGLKLADIEVVQEEGAD